MLVGRVISMGFSFAIVGMLARYFSGVEFGLYAVLTSVMILQNNLDFGLGNGLRDKLATLAGNQSLDSTARHYFLTTLYVLSLLAFVLVGALGLSTLFLPWQQVFNLTDTSLATAGKWGLPLIASLIVMNVPLSLSTAGFLAYQLAYWKGSLDLLSPVCGLAFVAVAIFVRLPFYPVTAAYFLGFTVANLVSLIVFMQIRHWSLGWIDPRKILVSVQEMARISIIFWYQGILAAISVYLGTLITSQVQGLDAAGDFNVLQRLFFLIVSFHLATIIPFWSAFTQAQAVGDWTWAKVSLNRMVLFSVGGVGTASLLIVFLYRPLVFLWTGKTIDNLPLVLAMAAWTLLYAWTAAYSMALNGFRILKIPLVLGTLVAATTVPLNSYLGWQMGPVGIMLGQSLLLIPGVIIGPILSNYWINAHLSKSDREIHIK